MKKILMACCLSLTSLVLTAQSVSDVDQRLRAVFPEDELSHLIENFPQNIRYLNWYLDNSYIIQEVEPSKYKSLPYLRRYDPINQTHGEEVSEINEDNLNIFFYSFDRLYNSAVVYRIGNTSKIITFHSYKHLNQLFNKTQNYEN